MRAMDAPLVLASASPRRRRLIAWLGVPFEVVETDTPEDLSSPLAGVPPVLARSIAADKAREARAASGPDAAIVACDTIVVLDRRVLGKPRDLEEASGMLRELSGREHQVITGVALFLPHWSEPRTFAVTTPVRMHDLEEERQRAWMEKGDLLGCAGAYNIEDHLASVDADQCYQNVAGLPLCHLYAALRSDAHVRAWLPVEPTSPLAACDAALCRACELGPSVLAGA